MADLGRYSFNGAGNDAECCKKHGVAIARDHLCGNWLWMQAQFFRDIFFNEWIDIGKRADGARDRACRDVATGGFQAAAIAIKFGIGLRHFEAKSDRLSVDAVAAANAHRVLVFIGALLDRGEEVIHVLKQEICRADKLHIEASVENIRRGHALVHEAGFVANMFRHIGQKGDHIVFCLALDFVNAVYFEGSALPEGLSNAFRDNAEFGLRITGVGLDFKPDLILRVWFPDFSHLGALVAWDHFGGPNWWS